MAVIAAMESALQGVCGAGGLLRGGGQWCYDEQAARRQGFAFFWRRYCDWPPLQATPSQEVNSRGATSGRWWCYHGSAAGDHFVVYFFSFLLHGCFQKAKILFRHFSTTVKSCWNYGTIAPKIYYDISLDIFVQRIFFLLFGRTCFVR
jgi:hypothetical protein